MSTRSQNQLMETTEIKQLESNKRSTHVPSETMGFNWQLGSLELRSLALTPNASQRQVMRMMPSQMAQPLGNIMEQANRYHRMSQIEPQKPPRMEVANEIPLDEQLQSRAKSKDKIAGRSDEEANLNVKYDEDLTTVTPALVDTRKFDDHRPFSSDAINSRGQVFLKQKKARDVYLQSFC